jgi:opacity protein-like surface antigen
VFAFAACQVVEASGPGVKSASTFALRGYARHIERDLRRSNVRHIACCHGCYLPLPASPDAGLESNREKEGVMHNQHSLRILPRVALGGFLLLLALALGTAIANATEIIPAVGMTRSVEGDNDARVFGSLSLRGQIIPLLATEVGVGYRQEDFDDDMLRVRTWPVTASLWLTPGNIFYAGAGVGWYNMSFDYDDSLEPPLESHTEQEFGVHLGGGLRIPLASNTAVDLHGRYVMMRQMEDVLVPDDFDPDFWSMSLGLAFRF